MPINQGKIAVLNAEEGRLPSALKGGRLAYGQRRQALIEAMIRVVAKGGLRRVTYRSVAEEAGVSHGLLVHHFGSMDVLIEETLDYCVQDSVGSITFVPRDQGLEGFAHGIIESLAQNPDSMEYQYEVMLESRRNKALRPAIALMFSQYRNIVAEGLSALDLASDEKTAQFVWSIIEGVVLHQLVADQAELTEYSMEQLRSLLPIIATRS